MKQLLWGIIIVFSFYSCIDNGSGDIDITAVKLCPEFAVPIAQDTILLEYYKNANHFELYDSLANIPDSLLDSLINYNNQYYKLPGTITYDFQVDFSFSDFSDKLDRVNSITIRTNIITHIPGNASTQVYFMQETDTLDKMYDSPFSLKGASVDGNGRIIPTDIITKDANFQNVERISRIMGASQLLIHTTLEIPSLDSINVLLTNDLNTWLQVATKVSVNIENQ
jgi:hypothetical protein